MTKGKVYIIGTGPGDYKLMTLKAIECIAKADVIVYDRLGSSKIKSFAKADAEFIYVGKMPDKHTVPQEGINEILVKKALEGKNIARVKGGDPFVFGRGGEEAEKLVESDIEFEIIPGITSAISVPAYSGIPVTHRDFCSSFHVITGHERPEKEKSLLDYEVLAKLSGTLIFLMGVKNISEISSNLIKHGKDPKTPAAVIEKGTTYEQRTVAALLEDIDKKVMETGIRSPAIIIVGDVVCLGEKLNWFPFGELKGKRVLVTRAREQASKLIEKVEELGGEAIEFPTIKIDKPDSYVEFDKILTNIRVYRWLVFTSVNGVKYFFERMKYLKLDIRQLISIKICAVGSATAEELNQRGLFVDLVPEKFTTDSLLKLLLQNVKPEEKVLLARADIANKDLSEGLFQNGIEFDDLIVYKTEIDVQNREEIIELLTDKKIDFITFTSSSTVTNFVKAVGEENLEKLQNAKIVCIGPVTSKTAEEAGLKVYSIADEYTIEGLVKKLII